MTIKEGIKKTKGVWLITLKDKTKWIIDLDNNLFDNYKWYKEEKNLESELTNADYFLDQMLKAKRI